MPTHPPLRCAIYIRVSTEEQNLNGLSLPAQRKALTEYAENNGYAIAEYYADEGISARKPMKYRKALLRLLEDVKQDKIDMILVTKLDRWFRNIKDYNITEEILQKHNCHWKTIFESYDTSTANGQMVINIMLSVNQAECDRTSERIKAVLDYKRSIGEITSGRCACYGYVVENNRLKKDARVAHIIDDAYACYFSCYSIRKVIRYLQEKYEDQAPSPYIVDRLFKNETYAGIHGNNHSYCEPYLTREQFALARKVTRARENHGAYDPYIFSSLIKCPVCGNNFTGFRKVLKLKSGGQSVYIRYRCGNKFNRHPSANISEKTVEDYMLNHVFEKLDQEILKLEAMQKKQEKKKNTAGIVKELDRLNILYQKGRIKEDYYEDQYRLLDDQLKEARGSFEQARLLGYKELQKTFSGNWKEIYLNLDKSHRQTFWKGIISSIEVDPETHKICGFHFIDKLG